MTPYEHQRLHIELHHALDQLLACWITETRNGTGSGSIHSSVLDLMQWSQQKTMIPSLVPENLTAHDVRSPADYEGQRGLIVLALARLALSHPEHEEAIRDIVRFYDLEGLPTFEAFKVSSADRVRESKELREAAQDLLDFQPEYSTSCAAYGRVERLKALLKGAA